MTTMGEDKFRKLPELAKPSLYKIRLAPCLKTFKCPGEASIQLEVGARFGKRRDCAFYV